MAHFKSKLSCMFCDYKSNKQYNVTRHMVLKHRTENVDSRTENVDSRTENVDSKIKNCQHTFSCDKCYKTFARNYNLTVHKETCKNKINPLQCDVCNLCFASRSSLSHHKNRNMCQQKQIIQNINNTNTINNITTNNINSNNNTTINIQLNNFGQENVSYLSPEFLNNCYNLGPKSIKSIMLGIYFDENHPENHTVKLISLKNEYVNVHEDGNWNPKTINDAIDVMKQTSVEALIKSKIDDINKLLQNQQLNDKDDLNISKMQAIQNIPQKIEKEIITSAKVNLIAVKKKEEN